MIARALFTIPGFDVSSVHTILTQATPHRMPVIALDPYLVEFYDRVNSYWLYNSTGMLDSVTVLSTGGGHRDIHVRDGLTLLDGVITYYVLFFLLTTFYRAYMHTLVQLVKLSHGDVVSEAD